VQLVLLASLAGLGLKVLQVRKVLLAVPVHGDLMDFKDLPEQLERLASLELLVAREQLGNLVRKV